VSDRYKAIVERRATTPYRWRARVWDDIARRDVWREVFMFRTSAVRAARRVARRHEWASAEGYEEVGR
jgi:hypothetical protein